jgi:hypothetical protein
MKSSNLQILPSNGKHSAEKRKRSLALLACNEGYTDETAAIMSHMSIRGNEELRKRFVEEGFEITLAGKPRGHPRRLID